MLFPLPAVPCLGLVNPTQPSDTQGSCPHLLEEARPAHLSLDLSALRTLSLCAQVSVASVSFNTNQAF